MDMMRALAQIAAQAPSTYELVRSLGAPQRRRARVTRLAKRAGWFGAGTVLGTGLVALLTPHNGREMRDRLRGQTTRARRYVMSQIDKDGMS